MVDFKKLISDEVEGIDSSSEFSIYVETYAKDHNLTIFDALHYIVEEYQIEYSEIKSLLSKSIIEKLELECFKQPENNKLF